MQLQTFPRKKAAKLSDFFVTFLSCEKNAMEVSSKKNTDCFHKSGSLPLKQSPVNRGGYQPMRSQPFQGQPPDIQPNEVFLALTARLTFHAQECFYLRRDDDVRRVHPRLLGWLIPMQFDTEDGGSTVFQKFGVRV
jgi:hypothetical protein